ncbi:hypothetical protein [Amycolatopsis sp. 195334CR]|uniref:hypothetical protein n=1 Tax=Amycolatopsis sp. 195334CR TaxID=2814588 RepID=UPI001A8EFEF2|nr:hypothetical protein [Amycolatopsis sp. 195334CR]
MPMAVSVSNRYDRLFRSCLRWLVSFGRFTWFDTSPPCRRGAPLGLSFSVGSSASFLVSASLPLGGFEAFAPRLPGLAPRPRVVRWAPGHSALSLTAPLGLTGSTE